MMSDKVRGRNHWTDAKRCTPCRWIHVVMDVIDVILCFICRFLLQAVFAAPLIEGLGDDRRLLSSIFPSY